VGLITPHRTYLTITKTHKGRPRPSLGCSATDDDDDDNDMPQQYSTCQSLTDMMLCLAHHQPFQGYAVTQCPSLQPDQHDNARQTQPPWLHLQQTVLDRLDTLLPPHLNHIPTVFMYQLITRLEALPIHIMSKILHLTLFTLTIDINNT
jgi:hypothetical protein